MASSVSSSSRDRVIHALPLVERRRIHPWLHVDGQGVVVGRVTDAGQWQLVSSDQTVYASDDEKVKSFLTATPRVYPDLLDRWPDEDADAWCQSGETAQFSDAVSLGIRAFQAHIEFPSDYHAALMAVWMLSTYFHRLFLAFPRVQLIGERGCGKTKVLDILKATAWNASLFVAPTPAVLFRMVQEARPTLLLDECERLNRDEFGEILAIINVGYKQGATVPRCEGERTRRVEFYEVYSPLAVASIKGLHATTADRAIPIVMQRGTTRDRVNSEVDPTDPAFARIRSLCYRLLLTRWAEVQDTYKTVPCPDWLNARARELWKPLLTVAHIVDRESGLSITQDLLTLAQEHVKDRIDLSAEAEALLAELYGRVEGQDGILVRPGELAEDLRRRLGWRDAPTSEQVGAWLRRLGFGRTRRDREGSTYAITAAQVAEVTARFAPDPDCNPATAAR